jgi:hypothetical protein
MAVSISWKRDKTPVVRTGSLKLVAQSYTLRCDAKQAEKCFLDFTRAMSRIDVVQLGLFFPRPFMKGHQPQYLETLEPDGVPVVNTLAIQRLRINTEACRYITQEDFDALPDDRKLKNGDVLLTMDGGTSIGKPVYFDLEDDYTVDSHVAILRPEGIAPLALVYLLASPFVQLQFQQAESGASGQTAVTEEDIRRFVFPKVDAERLTRLVSALHTEHMSIQLDSAELDRREEEAWRKFNKALLDEAERTV